MTAAKSPRVMKEIEQIIGPGVGSFMTILNSLGMGILVTDERGRVVLSNRFAGKLLNQKRSEVKKIVLGHLIGDSGLIKRIKSGSNFDRPNTELHHLHIESKGKKPLAVLATIIAIHNDSDRFIGVLAVLQDDSDYNRMLGQVRKSESRLRSIIDESLSGIAIIHGNRIVFTNREFSAITDIDAEAALEMDPGLIVPKPIKRSTKGSQDVHRYLIEYETPRDRKVHLDILQRPFDDAGVKASLVSLRDVTPLVRAERSLSRSNRLLSVLNRLDAKTFEHTDIERIFNETLEEVVGLLDLIGGNIYVIDDDGDSLSLVSTQGLNGEIVNRFRKESVSSSHIQAVRNASGPVHLYDVLSTKHPVMRALKQHTYEHTLATTIEFKGMLQGLMVLVGKRRLDDEEINIAAAISNQMGLALSNIHLISRLQESEQKYANVAEWAMDGILIAQDDQFLFVNHSLAKMLEYTVPELMNTPIQQVMAPESRNEILNMYKARLAGSRPTDRYETRFVTKTGKTIDVEIHATVIIMDNRRAALSIVRDISERKQHYKELMESEERFRHLFENAVIGVYRTTPEGEILMANPMFISMLGFTSSQDLASHRLDDIDTDLNKSRESFREAIKRDGTVVGFESKWIKQDGSVLYVRENARAVFDENGEAIYYEGTVEDITQNKLLEKQVLARKWEAELYNDIISHDINNFSQMILNNVQALQEGIFGEISELQRIRLGKVENQAHKIGELIDNVRELLLVRHMAPQSLKLMDLNEILYSVLDHARELFPQASITMRKSGARKVFANELLEILFLNLIKNGVTHNDKPKPRISVSIRQAGKAKQRTWEVTIKDNGMGIPDRVKSQVFERMVRHSDRPGSGLGLFIVHELVEQYNGCIRIEDVKPGDPSKGTKMIVCLPQA